MTNTIEEKHTRMVQALAKPGGDILNKLTPDLTHLLHMAVGISGQQGKSQSRTEFLNSHRLGPNPIS